MKQRALISKIAASSCSVCACSRLGSELEYALRLFFSPDKNKSATFLIMFKVRIKSLATLQQLFGDFC